MNRPLTPSDLARASLARDLAQTVIALHAASKPSYGRADHVLGAAAIVACGLVGAMPWIVMAIMWWND